MSRMSSVPRKESGARVSPVAGALASLLGVLSAIAISGASTVAIAGDREDGASAARPVESHTGPLLNGAEAASDATTERLGPLVGPAPKSSPPRAGGGNFHPAQSALMPFMDAASRLSDSRTPTGVGPDPIFLLQFGSLGLALATILGAAIWTTYFLARSHRAVRAAQHAAARARRARDSFLGQMSHELRTPLNAIIGFSELMRTEMMGPLGPRYREYARDIQMSGELLLGVVEALLDTAELRSDACTSGQKAFYVASATIESVEAVKPKAAAAAIALETHVESELGTLNADRRRYKRMLVKLLSDAVKLSPAGGAVALRVERRPTGELAITLRCPGMGADAGSVSAEPRVGHLATPASREPGLGLMLAKAYAEHQCGTFELIRGPGPTTTTSIVLRATSANAKRRLWRHENPRRSKRESSDSQLSNLLQPQDNNHP